MAGSYCVEKARSVDNVRKLEDLCSSYPPNPKLAAVQRLVTSELSVFQTRDQGYRVLLQQEDTTATTFQAYTLYKSKELDSAKTEFNRLCKFLDPLLEDCTLFLTQEILVALVSVVTPPMDPSRFIIRMKENATNSPLWNRVLEVLVVDEISAGNDEVARTLTTSLVEHTSPPTSCAVESDGFGISSIWETLSSFLNKPNPVYGTTPLMRCAQKNDLKGAFALLRSGADVGLNIKNEQDGNTALHYAVQTNATKSNDSSLKFVKLLLSYGARMDIKNKDGQTALQLSTALNNPAYQHMHLISDLTNQAFEYSRRANPVTPLQDGLCLLCLDGGGSRAVISCQILRVIEEKMQQLSKSEACGPLVSYFDYIAGTSAGGITALSLVYTKVNIYSSLSLSLKVIDKSFKTNPPSPTANTNAIEGCLKDHFTHSRTMGEVTQPRVMIMTTLVDKHPPDLSIVCNYGNKRNVYHPQNTKVWQAARATSAAPLFFDYFDGKCADGGLVANNPTLAALTELFRDKSSQPKQIAMVVSVGTGAPESKEVQHSSIYIPWGSISQLFESIGKVGKSVKELKQLWELFVTQTTRSDGDVVSTASAWCNSIGASYVRLSPILPEKLYNDFATIDEAVLTDMMYEGLVYALREYKTVDQVARCLLQLRGPQQST